MAQTGFTPILLYASGTPGNSPTAGNLTSSASGAELALNYADGKLFYKDSGGSVQTLATKATGSIGGSTTQVQYNNAGALAGSANLTFNGTTLTANALTVSTGNLAFSGTAQRITGDMSNATQSNRLAFQNSVTNGASVVGTIPNGTGTTSGLRAFGASDPTNANSFSFAQIGASESRISCEVNGTAIAVPMTFHTGGSERVRIDTSGNVAVGTTNAGTAGLSLNQNYNLSWQASATESVPNLFRQTSSAALVMSVGYKHSATANGFASSFGSSLAKTAISLGTTAGAITFYTDTAATTAVGTDVTPTERMRIDSSGNVGIGTASPGGPLSIQRGDASTTIGGSSSVIKVNNSNGTLSTTAGIEFFATADITVNTGRMAGIYGVYSSFNASGIGGALVFATNTPGDATIDERMRITAAGNIVAGASAALATTATDGFLYVPTCAGTPTGTPTAITGMAPIVVNTTNNKLYFYSGGAWRDAGP